MTSFFSHYKPPNQTSNESIHSLAIELSPRSWKIWRENNNIIKHTRTQQHFVILTLTSAEYAGWAEPQEGLLYTKAWKITGLSAIETKAPLGQANKRTQLLAGEQKPLLSPILQRKQRNLSEAEIILHYLLTSKLKEKYLFNPEMMVLVEIIFYFRQCKSRVTS